ncbi:MAG: aspartate kinase, partial [Candidatus Omnitrophica bacterium]|nr:aspartate kinase [Candidatus Omnitrophota bacterium]
MLVVQKYGGTSVATTEKIVSVAKRILATRNKGHKVVVVVSALGHTTDDLLALANKVNSQPSDREISMLLSTGEQVSVALLAMALHELGCPAISFTGMQVGIVTNAAYTNAKILRINTRRIRKELSKGKVVIVAGFQGVNLRNDITTLGRGGSNLTAVALAAVLKAQACEMNTDVDGVYTADPRIVPGARKLSRISYEEMLELSSLGVQVLQPRSVQFAQKYNVPIHVRSSFSQKNGTLITKEVKTMEKEVISGVTATKNEAKICIRGV